MELSPREATIISYALTCLIVDGHPDLNVTNEELRDISSKVLRTQYKAEKTGAPDYGYGTFPAH
jgi:hypothetical protein